MPEHLQIYTNYFEPLFQDDQTVISIVVADAIAPLIILISFFSLLDL